VAGRRELLRQRPANSRRTSRDQYCLIFEPRHLPSSDTCR
jgi:hypothetical protein